MIKNEMLVIRKLKCPVCGKEMKVRGCHYIEGGQYRLQADITYECTGDKNHEVKTEVRATYPAIKESRKGGDK